MPAEGQDALARKGQEHGLGPHQQVRRPAPGREAEAKTPPIPERDPVGIRADDAADLSFC